MEGGALMTPREYIGTLERLVASAQDQAALEFADSYGAGMRQRMTAEEFGHVSGLLESAATAVDLARAAGFLDQLA
jgi:hypothetical protein